MKTERTYRRKLGRNLKVGDTIKTWWTPGRDTITGLTPYTGKLAHIWGGRAKIASFALLKTGMTIDPDDHYEVVKLTTADKGRK